MQDFYLLEKLAHQNRERIPERPVHAKGSGAYGTLTINKDISRYTKAKVFAKVGKKTEAFVRFSTVAGERGAADAERDIRGTAVKFYTEEGNWDIVGNNTPVFFFRDPLRFSTAGPRTTSPRSSRRSSRRPISFPASAFRRTRCCRAGSSPTATLSAIGSASTSTISR